MPYSIQPELPDVGLRRFPENFHERAMKSPARRERRLRDRLDGQRHIEVSDDELTRALNDAPMLGRGRMFTFPAGLARQMLDQRGQEPAAKGFGRPGIESPLVKFCEALLEQRRLAFLEPVMTDAGSSELTRVEDEVFPRGQFLEAIETECSGRVKGPRAIDRLVRVAREKYADPSG